MTLEMNRLYLEDCMDGMKDIPDKFFQLSIVDPPYGIGINHNIGRRVGDKPSQYKKVEWDNASPDEGYFRELERVSRNQIIWGANHFITKINRDSPCWICWDKMFSVEVSFASFELAYTSFTSTSKRFVMHPSQEDRIHPTQKPIALYKWLLTNYAKPGDKILDTHVGSGSSIIACMDYHYDFMGFEIDKDYCNAAQERINAYASQMRMEIL